MEYSGAAPLSANCTSYASIVSAAFGSNLEGYLCSPFTLASVQVTDIASSTGAFGEETTPVDGSLSGFNVPMNCCVLINHSINRRYRGGKPRSYWPLGGRSHVSGDNSWDSGFVGDVQAGYNAFVAAISAVTEGACTFVAPINVSYYEGFTEVAYGTPTKYRRTPTLRSSPVTDLITGSTVRAKVGSQRRRLAA
jgi:hypothetical protein